MKKFSERDIRAMLSKLPFDDVNFWTRVDFDGPLVLSTPCWVWTANPTSLYGAYYCPIEKRQVRAHRYSWEQANGEKIPEGLEVDHLCKTTSCIRPRHLEVVTGHENILRSDGPAAINARRTECVNGHEFSEKNTRISPRGARECRECNRLKQRRRYAAKKAEEELGMKEEKTE